MNRQPQYVTKEVIATHPRTGKSVRQVLLAKLYPTPRIKDSDKTYAYCWGLQKASGRAEEKYERYERRDR